MFTARGEDGRVVDIDDAIKGKHYYCPCCGEDLIIKRGEIKVHHFAHRSCSDCDDFYKPLTQWHLNWQREFPLESRDVPVMYNGEVHRADILLKSINTVIEFQSTCLPPSEIKEVNEFFSQCGYSVVWVFNKCNGGIKDLLETYDKHEPVASSIFGALKDVCDAIIYDYGDYCYLANTLKDSMAETEEVYVPVYSLLFPRMRLFELLHEAHARNGMVNVIRDIEYSKEYRDYLLQLVLYYFGKNSRNSKTIKHLFWILGEYCIYNTVKGEYMNAYWKNSRMQDNKYLTRSLSNAITEERKTNAERLYDSIKFNRQDYEIKMVTLRMVMSELKRYM